MSKSPKIKRYSGSSKRNKPGSALKKLKWVGFLGGFLLLLFIGYSVAAGINSAFFKKPNPEVPEPPTTSEVSTVESEAAESSAVVVVDVNRPLKTLTVSLKDALSADGKDALLQKVKDSEYNSVLIELKNKDGYILYNSAIPEAIEWKSVKEEITVEALSAFVKELKAQDISAVAEIYAFEDNTSQAPNNTENTINFIMNGARWYDSDPAVGGKRWLNPNKPAAQKYIIDIAKEISGMGFERLLVKSAHYPNLKGMAAVVLDLDGKTQPQVLTEFAKNLATEVPTAQLVFEASALTVALNTPPYYANPAILGYSAVIAEKNFDVFTIDKEKITTIISNDDTLLKTAAENGFSTIKR
jgi:Uncharacterized conserved protein